MGATIQIQGHLVGNPVAKNINGGLQVVNIRVAVNDGQKNRNDHATYYSAGFFGKTGELIMKNFTKGSPIIVWGGLRTYEYTSSTSGKQYTNLEITRPSFEFPMGHPQNQGNAQNNAQSNTQNFQPAAPQGQPNNYGQQAPNNQGQQFPFPPNNQQPDPNYYANGPAF